MGFLDHKIIKLINFKEMDFNMNLKTVKIDQITIINIYLFPH